ncbi:hypothetical protein VC83_09368 [Pseudogymnoascus destructans]|uniref:Uncharacterized protein n=1 Tax=Pseudogymnoascus destructans TaxID=655981 RepID=A0A177A047_9PEZI|nr:uncharacterized protein VC83_09368 [Pseudogymnoascus destructans]OAF54324.1 hypothetical protein VC83_09368 [Pseudogymnoascus destructans]
MATLAGMLTKLPANANISDLLLTIESPPPKHELDTPPGAATPRIFKALSKAPPPSSQSTNQLDHRALLFDIAAPSHLSTPGMSTPWAFLVAPPYSLAIPRMSGMHTILRTSI